MCIKEGSDMSEWLESMSVDELLEEVSKALDFVDCTIEQVDNKYQLKYVVSISIKALMQLIQIQNAIQEKRVQHLQERIQELEKLAFVKEKK